MASKRCTFHSILQLFLLYQYLCGIISGANTWISYPSPVFSSPVIQYYYSSTCRGWSASISFCESIGGELASGQTTSKRNFLVNTVYDGTSSSGSCTNWPDGADGVYIGGDIDTSGTDHVDWFDGTTTALYEDGNLIDWDTAEDEPDNLSSHTVMGFSTASRQWHSVYPGDTNICICQRILTNPPTPQPTAVPSPQPVIAPEPSNQPTIQPTTQPTRNPSNQPTVQPTALPTLIPTSNPSNQPINQPTDNPSDQPSSQPTNQPTYNPSTQPTAQPTNQPTEHPTDQPTTDNPTESPLNPGDPTKSPSNPTLNPTVIPSSQPIATQTPSNIFPSYGRTSTETLTSIHISNVETVFASSDNVETTQSDSGESKEGGKYSIWEENNSKLVIGVLLLIVICVCLFGLFMHQRRAKEREKRTLFVQRTLSQHLSVASATGGTTGGTTIGMTTTTGNGDNSVSIGNDNLQDTDSNDNVIITNEIDGNIPTTKPVNVIGNGSSRKTNINHHWNNYNPQNNNYDEEEENMNEGVNTRMYTD